MILVLFVCCCYYFKKNQVSNSNEFIFVPSEKNKIFVFVLVSVRACMRALSRSFEPSFRLTENAEEASPQKGRKLRVTSLLADLRTGKKLSFGLKTFFPRPVTADCARHPVRRARCACVLALTSRSDKTTTVGLAPTGTTSHCLCACLQARTRGRAEVQMHARAGRATKS